jgi:hypothetical protein
MNTNLPLKARGTASTQRRSGRGQGNLRRSKRIKVVSIALRSTRRKSIATVSVEVVLQSLRRVLKARGYYV